MRVNELRCKEVVNVTDGARLGLVDDVEFTLPKGDICAITVLGRARLVCIDPPNQNSQKNGFFSSLFK